MKVCKAMTYLMNSKKNCKLHIRSDEKQTQGSDSLGKHLFTFEFRIFPNSFFSWITMGP